MSNFERCKRCEAPLDYIARYRELEAALKLVTAQFRNIDWHNFIEYADMSDETRKVLIDARSQSETPPPLCLACRKQHRSLECSTAETK